MTYERMNGEVVKVTKRQRVKLAPVGGQYCPDISDEIIRERVRGMDDRERMIVLDEIRHIYESMIDTSKIRNAYESGKELAHV